MDGGGALQHPDVLRKCTVVLIWQNLTHPPNQRKHTSKPGAPRLTTCRGKVSFNLETAAKWSMFSDWMCLWFCLKACWEAISVLPWGDLRVEDNCCDDWMGWTEDTFPLLCVDEWSTSHTLAGGVECGSEREYIYLKTFSHDRWFVCLISKTKVPLLLWWFLCCFNTNFLFTFESCSVSLIPTTSHFLQQKEAKVLSVGCLWQTGGLVDMITPAGVSFKL